MDEETRTIIKQRLLAAPRDIQRTVVSDEFTKAMSEIGAEYQLSAQEEGVLENEVLMVLLGISPAEEFIQHAQEEVGLDEPDMRAIAQTVNERVFAPLKSSLKKIHGLNNQNDENSPSDETANDAV